MALPPDLSGSERQVSNATNLDLVLVIVNSITCETFEWNPLVLGGLVVVDVDRRIALLPSEVFSDLAFQLVG
jgi:hypothetical protein